MAKSGADLVDTAVAAGSFKTLAAALQAADLVGTLKGKGPFTVFAPTDEAFAKLPKGTLEELLKPANKAKLTAILLHHVVPGNVTATEVVKLRHATAVGGQRLDISATEGEVRIDGVNVVKTDVLASNGVIHVIDAVLMPSTQTIPELAAHAGSFKTLLAALDAAELRSVLGGEGPFTVFAPTDAAFAKLPAGTVESLVKPENRAKLIAILKNHVVAGRVYADQVVELSRVETLGGAHLEVRADSSGVAIGGAQVAKTDLEAKNGVVHVIDTVIVVQ
ncbi:MAG: fasciclin domain-containing protein [Planctomycetes bacterium]|nr:fasciclin domain-containing protein [Planctomycetota bacterium]